MFFRVKKVKGKEYTYFVQNLWKTTAKSVGTLRGIKPRKGSRQKVKGYIGRAYRFSLANNIDFMEFLKIQNFEEYISNNNKNKIIDDLIEWELYKFNINKNEFLIDVVNKKIQKDSKNVALLLNDGFMCSMTLKNLLDFKPENEEEDGYRLARVFVEAGIKVPQNIFVGIFSKMYKS